jgi:hypothetical protein
LKHRLTGVCHISKFSTVGIQMHIGRRPILAFGNSDGDLQMLQWTATGSGARFMGLVHHTDAEREWAYDSTSPVGRLDKGLDEAKANNWILVSLKDDWNRIFSFEGKGNAKLLGTQHRHELSIAKYSQSQAVAASTRRARSDEHGFADFSALDWFCPACWRCRCCDGREPPCVSVL